MEPSEFEDGSTIDDRLKEALVDLHSKSRSRVERHSKSVLLALCNLKCKDQMANDAKWSKKKLMIVLDVYVGITSQHGRTGADI